MADPVTDNQPVQSNPFSSDGAAPRTSPFGDDVRHRPVETPARLQTAPPLMGDSSLPKQTLNRAVEQVESERPTVLGTTEDVAGTINNALSQGLGHNASEMWETVKSKASHLGEDDPITWATQWVQNQLEARDEAISKYSSDKDLGKKALAVVPFIGPSAAQIAEHLENNNPAEASKLAGESILQLLSAQAIGAAGKGLAGAASEAESTASSAVAKQFEKAQVRFRPVEAPEPTKVYHSTTQPVENIQQLDAAKSSELSAGGPGVYMSRDRGVVSEYAKNKPDSQVLEGTLHPDTKLLDAHAPLPKNVKTSLSKAGIEADTYADAMQKVRQEAGSADPTSKLKAVQKAVAREGYHGVDNLFPSGKSEAPRDALMTFGDDVLEGKTHKDLVQAPKPKPEPAPGLKEQVLDLMTARAPAGREAEAGFAGKGRKMQPKAETATEKPEKSALPPQPRLPETGEYPAIRTDDGGVYFDPQQTGRTHIMFAKEAGIPPERVTSGGWLRNGVYEESPRSDAGRWGEQARAQKQVESSRAARRGEISKDLYSGEDVVQHLMKTANIDENEAMGRTKTYGVGPYRLMDVPINTDLEKELPGTVRAGDDYNPTLAKKYAKLKTPLPAIVLDPTGDVADGNHRIAAATERGDTSIKAFVPSEYGLEERIEKALSSQKDQPTKARKSARTAKANEAAAQAAADELTSTKSKNPPSGSTGTSGPGSPKTGGGRPGRVNPELGTEGLGEEAPVKDVVAHYDKRYPKAGGKVDGRIVRGHVPNMSSIDASFVKWERLDGIREVPLDEFPAPPDKNAKSLALQREVEKSGELNPLIVGVDHRGPYILEGAHRYDALKMMGAKSMPAVVVLDMEEGRTPPIVKKK